MEGRGVENEIVEKKNTNNRKTKEIWTIKTRLLQKPNLQGVELKTRQSKTINNFGLVEKDGVIRNLIFIIVVLKKVQKELAIKFFERKDDHPSDSL